MAKIVPGKTIPLFPQNIQSLNQRLCNICHYKPAEPPNPTVKIDSAKHQSGQKLSTAPVFPTVDAWTNCRLQQRMLQGIRIGHRHFKKKPYQPPMT